MRHSLPSLITIGAALLLGSLPTPARAATMILHNFTGGASDGAGPYGSLTLSGSKFYGMTQFGCTSLRGRLIPVSVLLPLPLPLHLPHSPPVEGR